MVWLSHSSLVQVFKELKIPGFLKLSAKMTTKVFITKNKFSTMVVLAWVAIVLTTTVSWNSQKSSPLMNKKKPKSKMYSKTLKTLFRSK